MAILMNGVTIAEIKSIELPSNEPVITGTFSPTRSYEEIRSIIRNYSTIVIDPATSKETIEKCFSELKELNLSCTEYPTAETIDLRDYSEEIGEDGYVLTIYK